MDGINVPVYMPPEEPRPPYRNRKGQISQNVFVASSMDTKIDFVLSGWEGKGNTLGNRVYDSACASRSPGAASSTSEDSE